jgi:hypothetical protein
MTSNLTRLERALCEVTRHTYNDHRLWRRIAIPAANESSSRKLPSATLAQGHTD